MTPADKEPWCNEAPAVKAAGGWPPADGNPYMPANGTEGECFQDYWCAHCVYEAKFREQFLSGGNVTDSGCPLLQMATGPGTQPKEWVWKDGHSVCTKFLEDNGENEVPEPRCPHTIEMFE